MNKGLNITQIENEKIIDTIDSREVAEMMSKKHSDLLKDIQGSGKNLGLIPILDKGNFHVSDYFIKSSYKNSQNKEQPCYLVTKMGCEMLGNKQKGEKGILFTAKYVKRFNEMEKHIKTNTLQTTNQPSNTDVLNLAQAITLTTNVVGNLVGQVQNITEALNKNTRAVEVVKDTIKIKDEQIDRTMDLIGFRAVNTKRLTEHLKERLSEYYGWSITANTEVYRKAKRYIFKEFDVIKWEDIPANRFSEVYVYIDELEMIVA